MNRDLYKEYVDKFSEMMDMLVVRHELLRKKKPSSHYRVKMRSQVVHHLEARYPDETEAYRRFVLWLDGATGGDFRSIPIEEVPEEMKAGHYIYNSVRGHLAAKARYRNNGLDAYQSAAKQREIEEEVRRAKVLEAASEGHFEDELTYDINLMASPFLNPHGDKVRERADAIRRFNLALDRCCVQGQIFPTDEVTGFLLGIEASAIAHWRYNRRDYQYEKVGDGEIVDGWRVRITPQKSLLERVTDKLKGLSEEELESLRQLLMADE